MAAKAATHDNPQHAIRSVSAKRLKINNNSEFFCLMPWVAAFAAMTVEVPSCAA